MVVSPRAALAAWFLSQPEGPVTCTVAELSRLLGTLRVTVWTLLRHFRFAGALEQLAGSRGRGRKSVFAIQDRAFLLRASAPAATVAPEKAIGVHVPSRGPTERSGGTKERCTYTNGLFWKLEPGFFSDVDRIRKAFDGACGAGFAEKSEAGFLKFVALVCRAKRLARDVVKFVAGFVRQGLWSFLTLRDEDAARALLAAAPSAKRPGAVALDVAAQVIAKGFEQRAIGTLRTVDAPPPPPRPRRETPARVLLAEIARGKPAELVARSHGLTLDELRATLLRFKEARKSA